jgi:vanillate O-demethylase monooxygenase subunit
MYPFRNDETFVRNAWYVGCTHEEVAAGPIERTILDKPVVFYRSESGAAMAMHGLCPHRAYPLALKGQVKGDSLQCGYHGFTFDGRTGSCVRVPSQASVPSYKQRVYPVLERGPWIWIWPGDPSLADVATIPSLDEVGFGQGWKYLEPIKFSGIKGRYSLLMENLLDLTHVAYLHGDMGDFDAILQAPMRITEKEDRLTVVRPMQTGWTRFHASIFGDENRFEGGSESASITTFYGPGYITTTGYITSAIEGKEAVDKTIYGDMHFHHAITPETPRSCHYFGMSSRTHRLADKAFDEMLNPFDAAVRKQDVDAVEAIEGHMNQFGEPVVELLVNSDTAAAKLRRLMQRLIDNEQPR